MNLPPARQQFFDCRLVVRPVGLLVVLLVRQRGYKGRRVARGRPLWRKRRDGLEWSKQAKSDKGVRIKGTLEDGATVMISFWNDEQNFNAGWRWLGMSK